jgi:hypothetical protein
VYKKNARASARVAACACTCVLARFFLSLCVRVATVCDAKCHAEWAKCLEEAAATRTIITWPQMFGRGCCHEDDNHLATPPAELGWFFRAFAVAASGLLLDMNPRLVRLEHRRVTGASRCIFLACHSGPRILDRRSHSIVACTLAEPLMPRAVRVTGSQPQPEVHQARCPLSQRAPPFAGCARVESGQLVAKAGRIRKNKKWPSRLLSCR